MKPRLLICLFSLVAICLAGCPDYSHLRSEPDWSKQGEGGPEGEDGVEKSEKWGDQ